MSCYNTTANSSKLTIESHLVSLRSNMERPRALSVLVQGRKLEKEIQHSRVCPLSLDTEGHLIRREEQTCYTKNRIVFNFLRSY